MAIRTDNMANLSGRTALVTGGNSGIGLAIARRLASDGARILINGIVPEDEGALVCEDIATLSGVDAHYVRADLRDPAQIEALIRRADAFDGGLSVLVNNAGMQHTSTIEDFPVDVWNDMVAVNLSASFHTMRLALPAMRRRDWGRIVNVASISGLRGRAGKTAYNATKHGLIGLTKAVALETATTAITCNAICPGTVESPSLQQRLRDQGDYEAARKAFIARQPIGRIGQPSEIADLAIYLATATYTTGQMHIIDGGWVN